MSLISEQAKELRRVAGQYDLSQYGMEVEAKELMRRAADTIEALSKKVRATGTEKSRAVKIAADMMVAAELCRHEDITKCRRTHVDENICGKCIEKWLLKKAQQELKKGIRR